LLLKNLKNIIQAGYDLPCKGYIAGVYSDSEDEECDRTPIMSGLGKVSPPVKTDVFKTGTTQFYRSLPHYIPVLLEFNEIDGRVK